MNKKVVISKEAAEVLDYLIGEREYDSRKVVEYVTADRYVDNVNFTPLRELPFDDLMSALLHGFDLELTEEERHAELLQLYRGVKGYGRDRYFFKEGIRTALRTCAITVAGIND